jgi:hypothetical protein
MSTKVGGIDSRPLRHLRAKTPGAAEAEKFVKKLEEKLLADRGLAPHTSVRTGNGGALA